MGHRHATFVQQQEIHSKAIAHSRDDHPGVANRFRLFASRNDQLVISEPFEGAIGED